MTNVKKTKDIMLKYFKFSEFFVNCDRDEICEAVQSNAVESLYELAQIMDSFREYVGKPIVITSGFRNKEHNQRVGGVKNSQHMYGEACDFYIYGENVDFLLQNLKEFLSTSIYRNYIGQVIIYNSFVHIALKLNPKKSITYYDKRNN